jgi:transposase
VRKHYIAIYKETIAKLKAETKRLRESIRPLELYADKMLKQFKTEEQRRIVTEAEYRKTASANIVLKQKISALESQRIDQNRLQEELEKANKEIKSLQKKLNIRLGSEAPFGHSTPSSKVPHKKNSSEENQAKRGGAQKGHKGHGRKKLNPKEADAEIHLEAKPEQCTCGCGEWEQKKTAPIPHSVFKFIPSRIEKCIYYKYLNECTGCGKTAVANVPGTLPRSLYSNSMIAHLLTEFFLWGNTAGTVASRNEVNIGTFFNIAHRTAMQIKPIFDNIISEIVKSLYIHADETGWMKDGTRGYAWLFANDDFRLFICRHSRSSKVPLSVLGGEQQQFVLITDRYAGYNVIKAKRQYCYVHLIRDLVKMRDEFPDDMEIRCFSDKLKQLMNDAISLHTEKLLLRDYRVKAKKIKRKIMKVCNKPAHHPGIQHIQNIFREKTDNLFQWVQSPKIPAENNYAERALRPLVIARKICFGSHSEQGLDTREIIMTILNTAKCRGHDPAIFLEKILDILAKNKNADISKILSIKPEIVQEPAA